MTLQNNQLLEDVNILLDTIKLITQKVVSRYIARTIIPFREKEDVEMAVIENFLKKKDKINASFKGESQPNTYYTAIINRMCCEIIRKEKKHWYSVNEREGEYIFEISSTKDFESAKGIIIKDEISRLATTILFFNGTRAKVNLFLKYYFDIALYDEDIEQYYNKNPQLIKDILCGRESLSKAQIFDNLAQVTNIAEDKNIAGDAVRMWINKQIDIILNRINENGKFFYNRDSLSVLLEIQQEQTFNEVAK